LKKQFFTAIDTISSTDLSSSEEIFSSVSQQEQSIDSYDLNHANVYLYSFTHYKNLEVILGVSFDLVDRRFQKNIKQFSPKFGLLWNLTDSTTFRAAYFQGIEKHFNENQTIEPVQIAGFVQFLDGGNVAGPSYEQFGLGLDHKINKSLYFGLEGIYRQTKVSLPVTGGLFAGDTTDIPHTTLL
jgi:hypothetical protein